MTARRRGATDRTRVIFPAAVPRAEKPIAGRTEAERTPMLIRANGIPLPDVTRARFRRQAARSLSVFARRIRRIVTQLHDESGPTGAPLVGCTLRIYVDRLPDVVTHGGGADAQLAFADALAASRRALRSLLQKRRAVTRVARHA